MKKKHWKLVILDYMLYAGAAISSPLFVLLAQCGGWTAAIVSWIVTPIIAVVILLSQKNLESETAAVETAKEISH